MPPKKKRNTTPSSNQHQQSFTHDQDQLIGDDSKDIITDATHRKDGATAKDADAYGFTAKRKQRRIGAHLFRNQEDEAKFYALMAAAQDANLSGDTRRAKGLATQAVRIKPHADCFNLLQSIAEAERDLQRANEYRLLTAFFSNDVTLWRELYEEYMQSGEIQRSIMCLKKLYRLTADLDEKYQLKIDEADLLLALGDVNKAEGIFREMWQASKETDFGVFSQLSSLLYSRGKFETLQKYLTAALERSDQRLKKWREMKEKGIVDEVDEDQPFLQKFEEEKEVKYDEIKTTTSTTSTTNQEDAVVKKEEEEENLQEDSAVATTRTTRKRRSSSSQSTATKPKPKPKGKKRATSASAKKKKKTTKQKSKKIFLEGGGDDEPSDDEDDDDDDGDTTSSEELASSSDDEDDESEIGDSSSEEEDDDDDDDETSSLASSSSSATKTKRTRKPRAKRATTAAKSTITRKEAGERAAANPTAHNFSFSNAVFNTEKQKQREKFNPQGHLTLINIQSELFLERGDFESAIKLITKTVVDLDLPAMEALPADLALRLSVAFAMTSRVQHAEEVLDGLLKQALKQQEEFDKEQEKRDSDMLMFGGDQSNNNNGGGGPLQELVDVFYDGASTLLKLGQTKFALTVFKTLRKMVFPLISEDADNNTKNNNSHNPSTSLYENANNFMFDDFNYNNNFGNNNMMMMMNSSSQFASEEDEAQYHQEQEEKNSAATAILYGLGRCLFLQGELDEAYRTFQKALERSPNHSLTRVSLAEVSAALEDEDMRNNNNNNNSNANDHPYQKAIDWVTPTVEDEMNNEKMEKIRLHCHRARYCLLGGRYVDCVTSALFVLTRWMTSADDDDQDKQSIVAGSEASKSGASRQNQSNIYKNVFLPKLSSSSSVLIPAYTLSTNPYSSSSSSTLSASLSSVANSFKAATVARQSMILARKGPTSATGSFVGSAVGRSSEYTSHVKHQTDAGGGTSSKNNKALLLKNNQRIQQELAEEKFRVEGIFKAKAIRGAGGSTSVKSSSKVMLSPTTDNEQNKVDTTSSDNNNSDGDYDQEQRSREGSVGRLSDLDDFEEENFGVDLNEFDFKNEDEKKEDEESDNNNKNIDDDGFALPTLVVSSSPKDNSHNNNNKKREEIKKEQQEAEKQNNSIPSLDEVAGSITDEKFRNIFLEATMGNPGSRRVHKPVQQQQQQTGNNNNNSSKDEEEKNKKNTKNDKSKKSVGFALSPISFGNNSIDNDDDNNNQDVPPSSSNKNKISPKNNQHQTNLFSNNTNSGEKKRTKLDEWREMELAAQSLREPNMYDIEFLIGQASVIALATQCSEAYHRLGQDEDAVEILKRVHARLMRKGRKQVWGSSNKTATHFAEFHGQSYDDDYHLMGFPLRLALFRCAVVTQTQKRLSSSGVGAGSSSENNINDDDDNSPQRMNNSSSSFDEFDNNDTINNSSHNIQFSDRNSCVGMGCDLLRKAAQNRNWSEKDKHEIWEGIATFMGCMTRTNHEMLSNRDRSGMVAWASPPQQYHQGNNDHNNNNTIVRIIDNSNSTRKSASLFGKGASNTSSNSINNNNNRAQSRAVGLFGDAGARTGASMPSNKKGKGSMMATMTKEQEAAERAVSLYTNYQSMNAFRVDAPQRSANKVLVRYYNEAVCGLAKADQDLDRALLVRLKKREEGKLVDSSTSFAASKPKPKPKPKPKGRRPNVAAASKKKDEDDSDDEDDTTSSSDDEDEDEETTSDDDDDDNDSTTTSNKNKPKQQQQQSSSSSPTTPNSSAVIETARARYPGYGQRFANRDHIRNFKMFSFVDEARCATLVGHTAFQLGSYEESCLWYLRALRAILWNENVLVNNSNSSKNNNNSTNNNNNNENSEEIDEVFAELNEETWELLEKRLLMMTPNDTNNTRNDTEDAATSVDSLFFNNNRRRERPEEDHQAKEKSVLDPYDDTPHFSIEDVRLLLLLISISFLLSTGNRRRSTTLRSPFTARAFSFLNKYGTFGFTNNNNSERNRQHHQQQQQPSSFDAMLMTMNSSLDENNNDNDKYTFLMTEINKLQIAYNSARTFHALEFFFLAIPLYDKVIDRVNELVEDISSNSSNNSSSSGSNYNNSDHQNKNKNTNSTNISNNNNKNNELQAIHLLTISSLRTLQHASAFNLSTIYGTYADSTPSRRGFGITHSQGYTSRIAARDALTHAGVSGMDL